MIKATGFAALTSCLTLCLTLHASIFSSDIDAIFKAAKREKKLVLIDFFGVWCPPCNELDETVFETAKFQAKAKPFKLLQVDVDQPASWKLKDKYKVGGYPTLLFTNAEGKEIYRVVGYRTLDAFLRVMDLVLNARGKDLSRSCRSAATEDLWRCATVCAEREDAPCATKAFHQLEQQLKSGTPRYEAARNYFVAHAANVDQKRDGYERLLKEADLTPQAFLWALDYLKLSDETRGLPRKPALLEHVLAALPKIASNEHLEDYGLATTDLPQGKAMILRALGKKEEAKAAWQEAAIALEKLAATLPKGSPARGFTLERIEALEEAGESGKALALAQEYREKFPSEFTFHFKAASLLRRSKAFTDALPVAKRAYETSYGDNRVRAGTLLVLLYATVPDRAAAKTIVDEVKQRIHPESSLSVRTHRYLKELDTALAAISDGPR